MLSDSCDRPKIASIIPYRLDFIFNFISIFAKRNPFLTSVIYFSFFLGIFLLGNITGLTKFYYPTKMLWLGNIPIFLEFKNWMASRVLDHLTMGFLAPIGAGLLCHLYNTISNTFAAIKDEDLVGKIELQKYNTLIIKLDKLYNSKLIVFLSIIVSLTINTNTYIIKTQSYLSIKGGITGLYGRMYIFFDFFMIILIFYKCIITVWALRQLLRLKLKIRPFHPDKAGGLRPIGRLAVAVNYILGLMLLYFTLQMVFDNFSRSSLLFSILFFLSYPIVIIIFFASLSLAHERMLQKRKEVLLKLDSTFEYYYNKLIKDSPNDIFCIQSSKELTTIYSLYSIAEKMPVWPFDANSLLRFMYTIALPLLIYFLNQLLSTDSLLYRLFF